MSLSQIDKESWIAAQGLATLRGFFASFCSQKEDLKTCIILKPNSRF